MKKAFNLLLLRLLTFKIQKASVLLKVSGFFIMFAYSFIGCTSCTDRNVRNSIQKQAIEITALVSASGQCVKAHNHATANDVVFTNQLATQCRNWILSTNRATYCLFKGL